MANFNQATLIGRLVRDPELKTFDSGAAVTKFDLAVNNKAKDARGEWVDKAVFFTCKAWNRGNYTLAEIVNEHLRKGSQVFVTGRLDQEKWEDRDGNKKEKTVVVVEAIQFLDGKKEERGDADEEDRRPHKQTQRRRDDDEAAGGDGVPW